jgi:four helix bundle protein
MQDFRKLEIYKRSIDFCARIYKFSSLLPETEKYGLISQIRRAASSMSLNISEGAGCESNKEFALFINYAYRSCNEVLACLEIINRLKLIEQSTDDIVSLENEGIELNRMLYSFSKKLTKGNKLTT